MQNSEYRKYDLNLEIYFRNTGFSLFRGQCWKCYFAFLFHIFCYVNLCNLKYFGFIFTIIGIHLFASSGKKVLLEIF